MKHIAGILNNVLNKNPRQKKIKGQMLIDAWPQVAGDIISAKSQVLSFADGILYVWVKDSVWSQHLALHKSVLIRNLNKKAGTRQLTDIRFQLGGKKDNPEEKSIEKVRNWKDIALTPEQTAAVDSAFADTSLPDDLKEKMREFFLLQKKRIGWLQEQGYPSCQKCRMPVVTAAGEELCICCKKEEIG